MVLIMSLHKISKFIVNDGIIYRSRMSANNNSSVEDDPKNKYGALLPKNGVYFLPDDKIISMLKYFKIL